MRSYIKPLNKSMKNNCLIAKKLQQLIIHQVDVVEKNVVVNESVIVGVEMDGEIFSVEIHGRHHSWVVGEDSVLVVRIDVEHDRL